MGGRIVLIGALAVASAAIAAPADMAGLWRTPVRDGLVRIAPCGAKLCGFVAGSPMLAAHPDQQDLRNKDPALRSRRIAGLKMLEVAPDGGGGWIYNPDDGQTYRVTMTLAAGGALKVKGCVVAPFCRTQTWTRARGGRARRRSSLTD